jgi:outer membrane protein TolC
VKALGERTRLEQARLWPDLLGVGAVSITRATAVDDPPSAFANDPFNAERAEVALLLRWTFDVAQWARVDGARAEQDRGSALLEAAEAQAEFKVREAYQQAQEARARLDAGRLGERSARGWVASVAQADAVGLVSARDFADAYLAYFTLRSRTLESIYDWNFAIAALGRATGTLLTTFEKQ